MSLQVNFNGSALVKPGAASRVISRLQSFGVPGTGNLAVLGTADAGAPGLNVFYSPEAMKAYYKSGDLADAADAAFAPSNDPRIPGGPAAVYAVKLNQSTIGTLTGGLVNGSAAQLLTITSVIYGIVANKISLAYDATTRVITTVLNDGLNAIREVSPVIPLNKVSIAYTGAGTVATATLAYTTDTAGTLVTAITGGPGSEQLNIDLALFATIGDLVNAINGFAGGVYTAAVVDGANPAMACTALDRLAAINIKTTPNYLTGVVSEIINWCNGSSQLVNAARTGPTVTGIPVTKATTLLTGATLGTSPNAAAWTTGYNLLKPQRIHAAVPLQSATVSATFAEVLAATVAYTNAMNATSGKNEVESYMGVDDTKTNTKTAAASTINSPHVTLSCQKQRLRGADSTIKQFPAWSSALLYAAMRCSAPMGEPITFKYVRSYGLAQDASFSLPDDTAELLLAGVTLYESVSGKGIRLVKGNTTYTRTDDDAYTEESIISIWKTISFDLRQYLEDTYTGTKGTPASVSSIADSVGAKLEQYRQIEAIVDTEDDSGNSLHAWREVTVTINKDICTVSATITPVEGINFILPTIYLTPVKLSA